jgi:high-affinity nickel-transport protein
MGSLSELAAVGLPTGIAVTVFLAGLRHGFDLDHIAAIGDITGSQDSPRRSFGLATLYATGHAMVVLILGAGAVISGARIPAALDAAMHRGIGLTLVLLGLYVVYSLIRFRRVARMPSRWRVVVSGVRRAAAWFQRRRTISIVHEHPHEHDVRHPHVHEDRPGRLEPHHRSGAGVAIGSKTHSHRHVHTAVVSDPFDAYGRRASFGIGMVHGIGAETPTQLLLLTTAAGVGGSTAGLTLLASFVGGLFVGNSLLAIAMTMGFTRGKRSPLVYSVLAGLTAALSLYIGTLYALGRVDLLPGFLGG